MDTICKKTLVIGIILLLVGVFVSSAISIDTESTKQVNIEECECNEIANTNLIINKLLERIEFYIDYILFRYGHIPELSERFDKILSDLNTLTLNSELICDLLGGVSDILSSIRQFLSDWGYFQEFGPILTVILDRLFYWIGASILILLLVGLGLDCDWAYDPWPP